MRASTRALLFACALSGAAILTWVAVALLSSSRGELTLAPEDTDASRSVAAPRLASQEELLQRAVTPIAPEPGLEDSGNEPSSENDRHAFVGQPLPSAPTHGMLSGTIVADAGILKETRLFVLDSNEPLTEGRAGTRGAFAIELDRPLQDGVLRALAPGYAPFETPLRRMRAGERRAVGALRLMRAAPLEGRVVDPHGRPVGGAEVALAMAEGVESGNRHVQRATSAPDGGFSFPEAPRTRVRLSARAIGLGERGLDHFHSADEPVTLELAAEALLNVRVVDGRAQRVPGAQVRITCVDPGAQPREGVTDAEGRLRFEGLGAAAWELRVSAAGHRGAAQSNVFADGREVEVLLAAWPRVTGWVLGADGTPVDEATVQIVPAGARGDAARLLAGERHAVAADGRFAIGDQRPGDFLAIAEAPGYAPTSSAIFRVGLEGDSAAGTIRLDVGGELSFTLVSEGRAVAGASAELYVVKPPALARWTDDPQPGCVPFAAGRSSAAGELRFQHVADGPVFLVVRSSDHVGLVRGPIHVADRRANELGPLELERGGRLSGVVRAADGKEVHEAVVMLVHLSEEAVASALQITADWSGRWSSPPLPAGRYQLRVRPLNRPLGAGGSKPTEVQLERGEQREIELEL
jgi:hypothetical protein